MDWTSDSRKNKCLKLFSGRIEIFCRRRNICKLIKYLFNLIFVAIVFMITFLSILFILYWDKLQFPLQWRHKIYKPFSEGLRPDTRNIQFYNLSSPLVINSDFNCIKTKTIPPFSICLYAQEVDEFISRDLKASGVWEPEITGLILEVLNSEPSSVFLDIGANIGYFALLSAKLGHPTLAIEPVLDHVQRIQRAVETERLERNMAILINAVSDTRMLATVRRSGHNQGDSQIQMEVKECQGSCPPTVKTIVLNDLTYLVYDLTLISTNEKETLPSSHLQERLIDFRRGRNKKKKGQKLREIELIRQYKHPPANVVVKVDAQGFEHKIFDNPDSFFDRNIVTHIFMEWVTMARSHVSFNKTGELPSDPIFLGQSDPGLADMIKVEVMIRFLSERGFYPYSTMRGSMGEALNPKRWHKWPHDIVWCHDSQSYFMAKLAIKSFLKMN